MSLLNAAYLQMALKENAQRYPERIAARDEHSVITYRELDERSNQLAHYLRQRGVTRESFVAVYLERTVNLLLSLIAISKAGGVYIPLLPHMPRARLNAILKQTNPMLVLTEKTLEQHFDQWRGSLSCLNNDDVVTLPSHELEIINEPADLAYVIFTSGSSGEPKGVMIERNGMACFFAAILGELKLSKEDRWLAVSAISFDIAQLELLAPLMVGAEVIIAPEHVVLQTIKLKQWIEAWNITIMQATPALWQQLITLAWQPQQQLKLLCGGESLPLKLAQQLTQNGNILLNLYGPTEATIWATFSHFEKNSLYVELGTSLKNTEVLIIENNQIITDIAKKGELYLTGSSLARGYWQNPELTAEKFVNVMLPDNRSLRAYRTGDIVSYNEAGALIFHGRNDNQIKYHGYRIELSEIENMILSFPAIQEAVVVYNTEVEAQDKIIAYYTMNEDLKHAMDSTQIREALAQVLPYYMIPHAFVELAAMPLTAHGKYDRKSLPTPTAKNYVYSTDIVLPQTEIQQRLASIWQKILNTPVKSIYDQFIQLGGHSLLLTSLKLEIENAFKIEFNDAELLSRLNIALQEEYINEQLVRREKIVATERAETQALSLSPAQKRLWFLEKTLPDASIYTIAACWRLVGNLNSTMLKQALNILYQRHSVLRTMIAEKDGVPCVHIRDEKVFPVNEIDYSMLPNLQREQALTAFLKCEVKQPLLLQEDHLVRATLVTMAEEETVFVMLQHHIISDGISMKIFAEELSQIYQGLLNGKEQVFSTPVIDYYTLPVTQKTVASSESLHYWKNKLANAPSELFLPYSAERPVQLDYQGDEYFFSITTEELLAIRELGQHHGVTPFMILLAAFQLVLHYYTSEKNIVVGVPFAGRMETDTQHALGYFVNILPLLTNFSEQLSLGDVLKSVRATTLEAYQHQQTPFDMIVDVLKIQRRNNCNPLFQAVMTLEPENAFNLTLADLQIAEIKLEYPWAKFDLTLDLKYENNQIACRLEYAKQLFNKETIVGLAQHFKNCLNALLHSPEIKVSKLNVLNDNEINQQYFSWNPPARLPFMTTLAKRFEEQVGLTPSHFAVCDTKEKLTYSECNHQANQLAHYLRARGVKPNTLVAVALDRSAKAITTILSIVKAGGAYLPLDSSYPAARLHYIYNEAKPLYLITERALLPQWQGLAQNIIVLEDLNLARYSSVNLDSCGQTHDLAYMLYTSGSTGQPKGVMIEQKSILNLVMDTNYFSVSPDEVIAQISNLAFDAATYEIWGALLNGACCTVLEKNTVLDADAFGLALRTEKVTQLFITTALFHAMVKNNLDGLTSLRTIYFGGEKAHSDAIAQFLANPRTKNTRLIQVYGPTECTTFTTYNCISRTSYSDNIAGIIGKPLSGARCYVLNAHQQLLPVGCIGELYIGGLGVARGYYQRADEDQQRFIEFVGPQNRRERLYRTGDLVRAQADGKIEFIGRCDQQIKLRGFRIELGEIAQALRQHCDVKEAQVLLSETDNARQLVAYIQPNPNFTILAAQQLRQALYQKLLTQLPEFMMPRCYVMLEKFPLTPNGKLDLTALPKPTAADRLQSTINNHETAPLEEKLLKIWQEVLKVEDISSSDSFFNLGGDSILSIQVIAKARQQGLQLSVKQLFATPTIAGLAQVLGQTKALSQVPAPAHKVQSNQINLVPIQHWFFQQHLSDSHHFNQAEILIAQDLHADNCIDALMAVMANHPALQTGYYQDEEGWHAVNPIATAGWCDKHDLTERTAQDQHEEIQKLIGELQANLNFTTGPIWRAQLLQFNDEQWLVIAIHHLAVDGVSWRIILEDWQTAYQQLQTNQTIALPLPTASPGEWADALNQMTATKLVKEDLAYWSSTLQHADVELPVDYVSGANTVASARSIECVLNKAETTALLQKLPRIFNTQINDVLLTALLITVSEWTKKDNLYLWLEGHGREESLIDLDLSRTVGWFTALFPVLLEKHGVTDPISLLKMIGKQLRQIPHKGLTFGMLHYLTNDQDIADNLNKIPQPEVTFNYLGQWDNSLSADTPIRFAEETAPYCLSPNIRRHSLLELNGEVRHGCLKVTWTFSHHYYHVQTIKVLAERFTDVLKQFIAYEQRQEPVKNALPQRQETYPASPLQAGFLFDSLYRHDSDAYLVQMVMELTGKIDISKLKMAWQTVINEHAILRSSFHLDEKGNAQQSVFTSLALPWVIHKWDHLSPLSAKENLTVWLQNDRQHLFQLNQAPLLRFNIFEMNPQQFYLVWSVHHVIIDGWCLALIFNDVLTAYRQLLNQEKITLPQRLPYRHYIDWLQQNDPKPSLQFWQKTLSSVRYRTQLTNLLTAVPASIGSHEKTIILDRKISENLIQMAKTAQVTLSTVLQGAWALVLNRICEQTDLVLGVTVSGRSIDLAGVENMVGLFINTVPVPMSLEPSLTIAAWLQNTQKLMLEIYDHTHVSLADIQKQSQIMGSKGLFDTLFVFENYPYDDSLADTDDFSIKLIHGVEKTEYPITVVASKDKTINIQLLYQPCVSAQLIQTIIDSFEEILTFMPALAAQPLASLPKFSANAQDPTVVHVVPAEVVVPPANAKSSAYLEIVLAEAVETLLQIPSVNVHDNLFNLGLHSLLIFNLLEKIKKTVSVSLNISDIFNYPTIQELAHHIRQQMPLHEGEILFPLFKHEENPAVFLFHPTGGTALPYQALLPFCKGETNLIGLNNPRISQPWHAFTSLTAMAEVYVKTLRQHQPEGPYYLAGWSLGGNLAVEVARLLVEEDAHIGALVLIDAVNLSILERVKSWTVKDCWQALKQRMQTHQIDLATTSGRLLLAETFNNLINLLQHRYLPCAIPNAYLLQAAESDLSLIDSLSDLGLIYDATRWSAANGWDDVLTTPIKVVPIACSHNTLMSSPHLINVAHFLQNLYRLG